MPYNSRPMHRLTREVRFAINSRAGDQSRQMAGPPTNSYAGFPSLTGLGAHLSVQVTLAGHLDPSSQYLLNIKKVDSAVRGRAIPLVESAYRASPPKPVPQLLAALYTHLSADWPPGVRVES